jgi:hypothetical protein
MTADARVEAGSPCQEIRMSARSMRAILRRLERALAVSQHARTPREVADLIADFAVAMLPGTANVEVAAVLIAAARRTTDAFTRAVAESRKVLSPATSDDRAGTPLDRIERVLDDGTDELG